VKARIKRISVAPDALVSLFTNGTKWKVSKGLPNDTRVRGFVVDPATQTLCLFLESSQFEEVSVYNLAPLLDIEFDQLK